MSNEETVEKTPIDRLFKISTTDGCACALMVGTGEIFFPALLLSLLGSSQEAGLLLTLPMFLASFVQILIFRHSYRFKSRKNFTTFFASMQALTMILLSILLLLFEGIKPWMVFVFATAYWSFAQAAGPIWNAWLGNLVGESFRLRFFSKREKWCQMFSALGLLMGGLFLSESTLSSRYSFAILFGAAALFRWVSVVNLKKHPCDLAPLQRSKKTRLSSFKNWVAENKKIFMFLFFLKSACFVSSPFFNPYMLKQLSMGYLSYASLLGVALFTRVVFMHSAEGLARRLGIFKLLAISCLGLAAAPILWTFNDTFWYLSLVQVIGGSSWACFDFCVLIYLMNTIDHGARSKVLVGLNFFYSSAALLGSILGAFLLENFGEAQDGYERLFTLSTVFRIASLVLLPAFFGRSIKVFRIYTRIVALRPVTGATIKAIILRTPK